MTHFWSFDLESMKLPTFENKRNELLFKKKGGKELFSNNPINTYNKINQAFGLIFRIENAIAYESLGAYQVFIKNQEIINTKLLNFDGIPPIINSTFNQNYPFKRSFNIITSKKRSRNAEKYIKFLLSDEGQELLTKNGFISLPK
jgi:phosphate transport system substrate-binding protein